MAATNGGEFVKTGNILTTTVPKNSPILHNLFLSNSEWNLNRKRSLFAKHQDSPDSVVCGLARTLSALSPRICFYVLSLTDGLSWMIKLMTRKD